MYLILDELKKANDQKDQQIRDLTAQLLGAGAERELAIRAANRYKQERDNFKAMYEESISVETVEKTTIQPGKLSKSFSLVSVFQIELSMSVAITQRFSGRYRLHL